MTDEIIRELWRIKDNLARDHGYNLDALVASLRKKEAEEEREVIDLRPTKRESEPEPPKDS